MAANWLRGWLIPMADARRRRGVSAVEPMKPGLAEAARPLSAAHWVRGCIVCVVRAYAPGSCSVTSVGGRDSTTEMQSAGRTALPGEPPMSRQSTGRDSGPRYLRAPSALLRAVAQPLPGPVSSARLRSLPSSARARHRNKPAPELLRRHRITHACFCKVLATATAYPKRAHVRVPLTWLSTSVWL